MPPVSKFCLSLFYRLSFSLRHVDYSHQLPLDIPLDENKKKVRVSLSSLIYSGQGDPDGDVIIHDAIIKLGYKHRGLRENHPRGRCTCNKAFLWESVTSCGSRCGDLNLDGYTFSVSCSVLIRFIQRRHIHVGPDSHLSPFSDCVHVKRDNE